MTDTMKMWNTLKNVNEALGSAAETIVDLALVELEKNGVKVGAHISNSSGYYRITKIECSGSTYKNQRISFALYGNKHRNDGTWGEHVHYIGAY